MRSIFLTVFLLVCFAGGAQVDDFQKDIIKYLNVNGTQQQYDQAYDEMFVVLRKNFENASVPESVWSDMKKDKAESLKEITEFLTFAYRKHFTRDEIGEMYTFYKTAAAQKMMKQDMGPLTEKENVQIALYFESAVAQKVEATLPALSEDISEISGHWSRDLFAGKMKELLKLGYVPEQ
ncbi:MAG: DUF2059 domain-containing protein [Bacteroidota bacterium]